MALLLGIVFLNDSIAKRAPTRTDKNYLVAEIVLLYFLLMCIFLSDVPVVHIQKTLCQQRTMPVIWEQNKTSSPWYF